ncbi:hypothetical protein [uncultured Sphaerochaeta sp.]|uniref:hypothetical protein n=1 Tax=uncultured Sphaerochaeta sp. TaxID=886478 RepID=UPI002A0A50D0|nr:hypothetical protein [uncultured Sphaerochaeta sp.]
MRKRTFHSVLVLSVCLILAGCATTTSFSATDLTASKTQVQYLQSYFGIAPFGAEVDEASFVSALSVVSGKTFAQEDGFGPLQAVELAVKAADLDELALTYTEEKATSNLSDLGIKNSSSAYLACAVDSGLLSVYAAKVASCATTLSGNLATLLVTGVADIEGKGPNYLGFSNDSDILSRISNAFNAYETFGDAALDDLGAQSVQKGITTGYNLKKTAMKANFLPALTLQYGHSDEKHARQLIALLNSEHIVARIQLEPKMSIYQYLLEWGPVPESTPLYRVEQYSTDLYLVHAVEYDLALEFASTKDMVRFNSIIEKYSKKYEFNQVKDSPYHLISGAWWQPLYSATVNVDENSYKQIFNCKIEHDGYEFQSFVLPEAKDAVQEKLQALSSLPVVTESRFVNNAFYRYLTGEDFQ